MSSNADQLSSEIFRALNQIDREIDEWSVYFIFCSIRVYGLIFLAQLFFLMVLRRKENVTISRGTEFI